MVRGDSWKVGNNEISPLGTFQRAIRLDMRMYKDSDFYDLSHDRFNSKF